MNTILQKRIEEASIEYTMRTRPMCIAGGAFADMAREINKNPAFIAGADYALQNQWISVDEALPECDKEDKQYSVNVFARTKDCIRYAYYDFHNESWYSVEGAYRFGGDVTHWMNVPSLEGGEE